MYPVVAELDQPAECSIPIDGCKCNTEVISYPLVKFMTSIDDERCMFPDNTNVYFILCRMDNRFLPTTPGSISPAECLTMAEEAVMTVPCGPMH